MSRELLLLEALCEKLGFSVDYEEAAGIPSGQIVSPAKYTLTGRNSVTLPIDGDEWSAIVGFILAHKDDIGQSINDFGDLMPVLDYFYRDS